MAKGSKLRREAWPTFRRERHLPVGGAVAPRRSDWLLLRSGRGQVFGQRAQLWVGLGEAPPLARSPAPSFF